MKNRPSMLRFWGIVSVGTIGAAVATRADAQVTFHADFMASDQPRVAWILEDPANPGEAGAIGPSEFFPYAVLDTGANGVVLGSAAYFEFDLDTFNFGYNYDRYTRAVRQGTGEYVQYEEIGVAGTQLLDVLAPYHLNIGSKSSMVNGTAAFAIENTTILGAVIRDSNGVATGAADFGSFSAIIGMPAMVGRVVEMDLRPMAGQDVEVMLADFHAALPAATANSLHVHLTPLILPPNPGSQYPTDPAPTYADVPLLTVTSKRTAGGTTLSSTKQFLLDTGAQTSIISTGIASTLGYNLDPNSPTNDIVDLNNDGQITDDDYIEVGGLGGTSFMPLVVVDEMVIPTIEGTDIVAKEVVVGVLDIGGEGEDALLSGVFGMNMLTSGYSELLLAGTGEYGRFTQIFLDFTQDGNWLMRFEVNPDFVEHAPEPATMSLVFLGGLGLLQRRRRRSA